MFALVAVLVMQVQPSALTKRVFHDHIPHKITLEMSAAIFAVLQAGHFLYENNMLKYDPRKTDWRRVVAAVVPSDLDTLVADQSGIAEVILGRVCCYGLTEAA